MLSRLWSFINRFDILTKSQYGFRKGCSTENAVVDLAEYFYRSLNSENYGVAVFVDFKKAFDTIDHEIMIRKMEAYGVRGLALKWFESFLANRKHVVKINDCCSQPKLLNSGLPQGALLSPVLFLLYVNDLPNISDSTCPFIFADDTTLCFSDHSLPNLLTKCNSELSCFSWAAPSVERNWNTVDHRFGLLFTFLKSRFRKDNSL